MKSLDDGTGIQKGRMIPNRKRNDESCGFKMCTSWFSLFGAKNKFFGWCIDAAWPDERWKEQWSYSPWGILPTFGDSAISLKEYLKHLARFF